MSWTKNTEDFANPDYHQVEDVFTFANKFDPAIFRNQFEGLGLAPTRSRHPGDEPQGANLRPRAAARARRSVQRRAMRSRGEERRPVPRSHARGGLGRQVEECTLGNPCVANS